MGEIGSTIKGLRTKRGLSQRALATELGIHYTTISQWETGKTAPRCGMLAAIASALSVEVRELVG